MLILLGICLLVLLIIGLPTGFALGSLSVIFLVLTWGPNSLPIIASRLWGVTQNYILVCVPLFVLMGSILGKSGIAGDLYSMMHLWSGQLRGGIAVGTIIICIIFAAMTGLSASATVTMGLIALPNMLERKYSKSLALGSILAGGALGILIPPSITLVLYGMIAQVSVGKLFIAGVIPGILLGFLFIAYIIVRAQIQPHIAPAITLEEKGTFLTKIRSLQAVILPLILIMAVMGSIFTGIATPTEAAAVGALGAITLAVAKRRLNWKTIKESSRESLNVTSLALWIYLGSVCFTVLFASSGVAEFLIKKLEILPLQPWGTIIFIQLVWLFLGAFIDPWGILMITGPIFCPVIKAIGFDLVWFGIIFIVNMEMAYLTPPFGFNLFYLKGVAPDSVSMTDIYRSVWPFVLCQLLMLILLIIFNDLALWLPNIVFGL